MNLIYNVMGSRALALLGAIGLFGMVDDFITLSEGIQNWVDAWQAITRPVWDFLFGWFFNWLNWPFPWCLKDYLSVGVINYGMTARSKRIWKGVNGFTWRFEKLLFDNPRQFLFSLVYFLLIFLWNLMHVLLWPFTAGSYFLSFGRSHDDAAKFACRNQIFVNKLPDLSEEEIRTKYPELFTKIITDNEWGFDYVEIGDKHPEFRQCVSVEVQIRKEISEKAKTLYLETLVYFGMFIAFNYALLHWFKS